MEGASNREGLLAANDKDDEYERMELGASGWAYEGDGINTSFCVHRYPSMIATGRNAMA